METSAYKAVHKQEMQDQSVWYATAGVLHVGAALEQPHLLLMTLMADLATHALHGRSRCGMSNPPKVNTSGSQGWYPKHLIRITHGRGWRV